MDILVEIEGLDDLTKQLQQLESLAKQKTLTYKALFFATKPMLDEVKRLAPKAESSYFRYYAGKNGDKSRVLQSPGKLKKSIKRKRVKLEKSVGVSIYSAPIKHGLATKYNIFYWRFLEYGTKLENGTPKMPAFPFIRPAFDHKKEESLERFKQRYREYVDDVVQRRTVGGSNAGE
ncbi:HK97-gp10 family putative phage morphogenesis protein [Acinetobacter parvus]|uniref:HK97-gp10 family putative phage morphogenesis protein n=1 Tax=Acinetobacter parvus TaxID=134533 RepID=UPI00391B862D